jgi:hypothetical protein
MADPTPHDPRAVLTARLEARRQTVAHLEGRDARIASLRLVVFLAAAAVAVACFALHRISAGWLLLPAVAFVVLVVAHDRALAALAVARRAVAFHEAGLARLDDRWAGTGDGGDRYASDDHPYARDLDLFGKGSLFELLCTARTRPGADALAAWLLGPAAAGEVRSRQAAVAELAPRLDLREDLAVLGDDVRAEVHPDRLSAWAETPAEIPTWLAGPALLLSAATVASLVLWFTHGLSLLWFLAGACLEWALLRSQRDRLERAVGGVERPGAELGVLALLLGRLEREPARQPLHDPRLLGLLQALGRPPASASAHIGALGRTVERGAWAQNQFFAPIAFLLLWRLHTGLAIERWRKAHGREVRPWLAAVAELEALSSLAGYAFLRAQDPFPELPDLDDGPLLEGEGLGHPLLPDARCVRNDVRLGPGQRLLVVSGSNMSGKSTYLRTVGANTVLALAGAPVRARRMRLSPLQIGATLRIQDSLAEGRSRFYAEITRLRAVMDLAARPPPVLFLLDELLAGTNSADRRIGAEAVLRSLLARGALGFVTTHDLALSEAAVALGEAANAHFEDQVIDGEVRFDYRLKPGVVTHSNALALMKAVGLDV